MPAVRGDEVVQGPAYRTGPVVQPVGLTGAPRPPRRHHGGLTAPTPGLQSFGLVALDRLRRLRLCPLPMGSTAFGIQHRPPPPAIKESSHRFAAGFLYPLQEVLNRVSRVRDRPGLQSCRQCRDSAIPGPGDTMIPSIRRRHRMGAACRSKPPGFSTLSFRVPALAHSD